MNEWDVEFAEKLRWPEWLTFYFDNNSQFRLLNFEFRILNSEFRSNAMYAFILFIILIEPCHVKTSLRGLRPEIQN